MIYSGTYWLTARMSPDYGDLEATDVYRRGRELSDEQDEAPKVGRSERVAEILETLVGFEIPAPLDYRNLTPEQSGAVRGAFFAILLPAVEQAWHRRLKDLPFPVRVDGTRFLFRTRSGEWEEDKRNTAALEEFAKRQQGKTKHETV